MNCLFLLDRFISGRDFGFIRWEINHLRLTAVDLPIVDSNRIYQRDSAQKGWVFFLAFGQERGKLSSPVKTLFGLLRKKPGRWLIFASNKKRAPKRHSLKSEKQ